MSGQLPHRNAIDKHLSALAEGDEEFKRELIGIYTNYMIEIPREFARFTINKQQEELGLLQHRHKTTCHVLALEELSETFTEARTILKGNHSTNVAINELINKVNSICNTTLYQLKDI
uniref:HPt domain-containing protein n=1 Tax=Roseihalotalea indica TaxID=2867963 RepID=A0AA49GQV7_9BACT|nr:hypothetical protein K4G66_11600 [Tunicatimonas sp. TK19036]